VLDTWFSSWLWPFSPFGWPEESEDLAFYYPTDTLVTASEIIFFWVARMIMAGLEFVGEIPFRQVYIHGTVRDDTGRKMSKSLGNALDPLDIIEEYSADALRFSLIMITATGQDVYLASDKFAIGRNFGTKIWNAARFMQMHGGETPPAFDAPGFDAATLTADNQHILSKLHETISLCGENLQRFRFNDYAKALYEFLWHQYCDWYVEYSKQALCGGDPAHKEQVLRVMHYVFSHALRLLHPVMPFLTEELWRRMGYNALSESIMTAPWPEAMEYEELQAWGVRANVVKYVDAKHDLIRIGRALRADYELPPSKQLDYILKPTSKKDARALDDDKASLAALLRAKSVRIDPAFVPRGVMPSGLTHLGTIYLSLEGIIDVDAEVDRLAGQLDKLDGDLERVTKKLDNINFVSKAPKNVVSIQQNRKRALLEKRDKLKKMIETLAEQGA